NTEVLWTDAPFRQDRRRFGQHESRTTDSATSKMHKMPVIRITIDTRVLTHRRDKDAVGKFDIANRERIEQVRHAKTIGWHVARGENLVLPRTLRARAVIMLALLPACMKRASLPNGAEAIWDSRKTACISLGRKKFHVSLSVPTTQPNECRL